MLKERIQTSQADILIVSPQPDQYQITYDLQQNLYKILCAAQNLKPEQKGSYRLGQALLDQHTAPITEYNANDERNIF